MTWRSAIATLALALWCAPLAGQPWVGTAAVGVQVSDRQGRPVPGAEVEVTYAEGEEGGGPGAVRTDAEGRAGVRGLAEGLWRLTVRHPDHMAYLANLRVREGRRPREQNASLVKVGDSLEPLRVRYFEVEGLPRRPAPEPLPAPPPPPAPAPAPPPPEPEPAPPPPDAAPPIPAPEAEPVPQPPPLVAMPEPLPEPEPPAAAEPAPEAPPESGLLAAAPPGSLRSFRDGTCPECQPGEWVATVEATAGGQGEGCPGDLGARAARAASLLAQEGGAAAGHAGPVAALPPVAPFQDDASRCRVLAVHLPQGARFSAFLYEARGDGWGLCPTGEPCPAGGGRWTVNPIVETGGAGTLVVGAYENPEGAPPQPVRLTAFWVPPSDWNP